MATKSRPSCSEKTYQSSSPIAPATRHHEADDEYASSLAEDYQAERDIARTRSRHSPQHQAATVAAEDTTRRESTRYSSQESLPDQVHPRTSLDSSSKGDEDSFFHWTIPSVLFAASTICWYDPSRFPALFFVFMAFAFLRSEALLHASKRVAVRHISDGITLSMTSFVQDSQQSKRFMAALSEVIHVALTNDRLTKTFKAVAVETVRDEELQSDILDTLTLAIVRATNNEGNSRLSEVVLHAFEQGFSQALCNEQFMNSILNAIVQALVSASQNTRLRQAVLDVSTEAVSTAVRDERFMSELKQVMKECLRDSELFRAGAAGMLGAVIPGVGDRRKISEKDKK